MPGDEKKPGCSSGRVRKAGKRRSDIAMLGGSKADLVISQPDSFDISYSSVDEQLG
jgi:hypothetical protein